MHHAPVGRHSWPLDGCQDDQPDVCTLQHQPKKKHGSH